MVIHTMIDLQPPNLLNNYTFLDSLLQVINTFAFLPGYVIVKRRTKVSKKGILRKTILIYNWNKEYYTKS